MSFNEGNLHERVDGLERENAELRELVGAMHARCRELEAIAEITVLDARFEKWMEDLGVEVER